MSNYSKTTNFTAKDALTTGDPDKLIKGSLFDTEFDAIAVASATKYDSGNLASQSEAEDETLNTVLMTPLRTANWADANCGAVGDLQATAAPAADRIWGYDFSSTQTLGFTPGNGVETNSTTLQVDISYISTNVSVNNDNWSGTDLTVANGGTGSSSAAGAATNLGVGTANSPQFAGVNVGRASDTTITRVAAGKLNVEGKAILQHDGAYTSGDITFSTSAPSGGSNGDIWFEYT